MATPAPDRLYTTTVCTFGHFSSAVSVLAFNGIRLPARTPSSAVITTRQSESRTRSDSDVGEKPPNTTE